MNKIIVSGRMTKDIEVRKTPTDKSVGGFTLAVDRQTMKDGKREADFIPVVVWNKIADFLKENSHKGSFLLVEGRLQIRNFDAKDGTKHWVTEIVASRVEMLDRKNAAPKGETPEASAPNVASTEVPEDEFPF